MEEHARGPIRSSADLAGRIARAVAHEINSPLTLVVTSLGCLRDDLEGNSPGEGELAELRGLVADAEEGARRVTQLLRTFRAVARPAADTVTRVDVNASLLRALELVRRELEAHGRMQLNLGTPPHVSLQGGLLHAWTHLFVVVAEALAQGRVEILTADHDGEARVTVSFESARFPGPLEPGLFSDALASADGRYEIAVVDGKATIEVYLPAG